jgi:single-strand DNA-binding protein
MAKDLNKIILSGRLGKDVELRYTNQGGTAVATFSVASSRNVRQSDETWKEETEWFRCVAWRDLAERAKTRLQKGSHVLIEGRLQTREWDDNQGQKHRTTEVIVNDIITLESGANRNNGDAALLVDDGATLEAEEIPF